MNPQYGLKFLYTGLQRFKDQRRRNAQSFGETSSNGYLGGGSAIVNAGNDDEVDDQVQTRSGGSSAMMGGGSNDRGRSSSGSGAAGKAENASADGTVEGGGPRSIAVRSAD